MPLQQGALGGVCGAGEAMESLGGGGGCIE